jgi:hypothetical protein
MSVDLMGRDRAPDMFGLIVALSKSRFEALLDIVPGTSWLVLSIGESLYFKL